MSVEAVAGQAAKDAADKSVKAIDAGLKKIWSILDAASEKKSPREYLSPQAISSIQGGPEKR